MSVARAYSASEMVVWFASGRSLLDWIPPVLRAAAPVVIVVALLTLIGSPWADRQMLEARARYAKRDDLSRVAPGRFIESGSSDRVFFVENVDVEGATVRNIFVNLRSAGQESLIIAAEGLVEAKPDGERFLVLNKGRRYDLVPGRPDYRLVEFESAAIRLDSRPDVPLKQIGARAKPTPQLLEERTPWNDAELVWRLGLPMSVVMLALLAIPLGYTNPRVGRSFNLIIAMFVFFLYLSAMQVMVGYVQTSRLPFGIAVWLLHAVVGLVVVALFARRILLRRWLPAWLSLGYWQARRSSH
jgi:lipopolysaccharide export system permease protein